MELKKKKIERSIESQKEEKRSSLREKRAELVKFKDYVEKIDGIAALSKPSQTTLNSVKYTTTVTVEDFDPES